MIFLDVWRCYAPRAKSPARLLCKGHGPGRSSMASWDDNLQIGGCEVKNLWKWWEISSVRSWIASWIVSCVLWRACCYGETQICFLCWSILAASKVAFLDSMGSNEVVCFPEPNHQKIDMCEKARSIPCLILGIVRNHFRRFLELTSKLVLRAHLSSWN